MKFLKATLECKRLFSALRNSISGLKIAYSEAAFKFELVLFAIAIPIAIFLSTNLIEFSLLIFPILLILIVEILNTGIEVTINRIGYEWNELSKNAKDLGSAAVLISLIYFFITWSVAILYYFDVI